MEKLPLLLTRNYMAIIRKFNHTYLAKHKEDESAYFRIDIMWNVANRYFTIFYTEVFYRPRFDWNITSALSFDLITDT